jgi:hypothetical protein
MGHDALLANRPLYDIHLTLKTLKILKTSLLSKKGYFSSRQQQLKKLENYMLLLLFSGTTILLSLMVFLLLVAETMPPTSDAVPLIGSYTVLHTGALILGWGYEE